MTDGLTDTATDTDTDTGISESESQSLRVKDDSSAIDKMPLHFPSTGTHLRRGHLRRLSPPAHS